MDRKSVLEVGKVLYHSGLPFRVRLFNILASLGFIISLCNGVLSYWNNGDRKLLLINTGIALLSLSLLFYAYHSKKYQRCYFITIVVIFMFLFPIMFFKSGGYKGGMPSFYIFGILFTIFMLEGWLMFLCMAGTDNLYIHDWDCLLLSRYGNLVSIGKRDCCGCADGSCCIECFSWRCDVSTFSNI